MGQYQKAEPSGVFSGAVGPWRAMPTMSRRLDDRHRPHHVVGDSVPQRHRLHLAQSAHQKLREPAPARNRVDALGSGGALLVDDFGCIGAHALTPPGYGLAVTGQRHVGVTARVLILLKNPLFTKIRDEENHYPSSDRAL